MKKRHGVLMLMAVIVIAAALALVLTCFRTAPSSPLPSPNGYDDLLKAGRLVVGVNYVTTLDHDALAALVATNRESLRLIRQGLTRRCAVPTDAVIANFASITGDLVAFKKIAKLLSGEGRLAEMESRPADAARSYIDAIRVGSEMTRGGLIMNRLVGITDEAIGSGPLVKLMPALTCDQMRPLVAQVEEIGDGAVAWSDVVSNEKRFARAQVRFYRNPIRMITDLWTARKVWANSKTKHDLAAARLRLIVTEMALRCYRCDGGRPPAALQQLVPKYLRHLPVDPFSDRSLVYHPGGTNWVLYSVGPNKTDDGGKPLSKVTSGNDFAAAVGVGEPEKDRFTGDLLYDSPW
jgi:hypothetical protein